MACTTAQIKSFLCYYGAWVDLAIIEGVMGLYDGGREGVSSTAQIAKQLNAPVVLVIDGKAMGESAAAIAKGFRDYDPEVNFGGVILNRLGSANHERTWFVKVWIKLVYLLLVLFIEMIVCTLLSAIWDSHLLLKSIQQRLSTRFIEAVEKMGKSRSLLDIASSAPTIELPETVDATSIEKRVKIGVAYDEAFSFYYPTKFSCLRRKGAELVYFSPLNDLVIPEVDGLVCCWWLP